MKAPRIGTRYGGLSFPGSARSLRRWHPIRSSLLLPPFLVVAREPGVVQIWSGYLARTAPGWALLSRGPANIPRNQGYEHFEGIIESETWFGPLFTNIRLTRTNSPVEFHVRYPLFQVQPLLRQCYRETSFEVVSLPELSAADWQSFEATMKPNTDQMRMLGHYAVGTRREAESSHEGSLRVVPGPPATNPDPSDPEELRGDFRLRRCRCRYGAQEAAQQDGNDAEPTKQIGSLTE